MYKYLLLFLIIANISKSNGQTSQDSITSEHHKKDKAQKKELAEKKHWKIHGTNSITGNQSSFSNWQSGGTSNITVDVKLNYDINYKKDKWSLDNKFIAKYGFNKNKENSLKKTDDRIELNSILARNFKPKWHYSFFFNFKSQFDKGLDPKDPKNKVSHFMSPVFLMAGPGILWKTDDDFKINFSPATPRFVFVHSEFTKIGKSFGVSQNQIHRFEFGATAYAYYRFKIMKNVTMENILSAFADYLYKPQNVDFNYQGTLDLRVNKLITANIYYEALYDYDTIDKLQQKQAVGLGLHYTF